MATGSDFHSLIWKFITKRVIGEAIGVIRPKRWKLEETVQKELGISRLRRLGIEEKESGIEENMSFEDGVKGGMPMSGAIEKWMPDKGFGFARVKGASCILP